MNGIPSLRISTSEVCNHRCSFCQIDGDFSSDYGTNSFSRKWVCNVIQSLLQFWKLGVRNFSITGGEPLLNPQTTFKISGVIRKLINDERAPDNYLRLNTNGVYVIRYLEPITQLYDLVKISLHTLNPDVYAKITNSHCAGEDLKNTLRGIQALNERKKPMRIQMVVVPANQDELGEMIDFCQQFSSIQEIKLFDLSQYSHLCSGSGTGDEYWRDNFVSLDSFENQLRAKATLKEIARSVGGYGNPMPIYQLGKLRIRLRRSSTGANYHPNCCDCAAYPFCLDGHCNLEIGPNELIKVCRPKEGRIFRLGQEKDALEYFQQTCFVKRNS